MPHTPPASNVQPLRPDDHADAARVAISWLAERHRKGWRHAFEDLMEHWRPEDSDAGWNLDDDAMTMLSINAGEWLMARGEIHARGAPREINGYLLGPDGPFLTPGQKAWLAQLRARPLRLYRVTDVRAGEGLTLVDELDPQAEPQSVREHSGSLSTRPGMLIGARIMHLDDAADPHLELSGAIYPFAKLRETQVLAQLREVQEGADALKLHADNVRDLIETAIARAYLAQWLEPAPLPTIVDAATGEPMLLVSDHYRVRDPEALAAALAAQPDVDGDAEHGWSRIVRGDDGVTRSRSSIVPGRRAGRIELFHRTQPMADEGRAWFEGLAGAAVRHLTQTISDPAGNLEPDGEPADDAAPQAGEGDAPGLPPEALTQALETIIHRFYENGCDDSIPALGGLTPRQAIATRAGLERVKGLLREYEDNEGRQSRLQRRPAVSYRFLWDALGISP